MVYNLDLEVRRLYDEKLPSNSRGREADNPNWFYHHFTTPRETGRNPNVVLAEDLDNKTLTWHGVCDWIITPRIINPERYHRELVASSIRNRRLRFLEVYSNRARKHFFLEPATSSEVSWEDMARVRGSSWRLAAKEPDLV